MMKRMFSLLLALLVLCTLTLTAYAHDVPQDRNDCSITLLVRYENHKIHTGKLTAIKIGYVDENNGDYFFSRVYDDVKLEDVQSPNVAEDMQAFYNANKEKFAFEAYTASIKSGTCTFTGLPTGLYLIVQTRSSEGYTDLKPFLVGMPYMKDGKYQYALTANIKTELQREAESTIPREETPGGDLPQTGQLNWPVPVLAVGGLVLFTVGWMLRSGRKKEENAE